MMLGFCGIALLSWQFAAAGEKRALALAGICVGIGGAVLCHYYGVMIYVPLAGAESFGVYRKRKIDKAIWAAFILRRRSASDWIFGRLHVAKQTRTRLRRRPGKTTFCITCRSTEPACGF